MVVLVFCFALFVFKLDVMKCVSISSKYLNQLFACLSLFLSCVYWILKFSFFIVSFLSFGFKYLFICMLKSTVSCFFMGPFSFSIWCLRLFHSLEFSSILFTVALQFFFCLFFYLFPVLQNLLQEHHYDYFFLKTFFFLNLLLHEIVIHGYILSH